ncbi:MAG TPA: acetyltransferase [Chitinophagaceae bacterium]|nr:acetyltransferase [Chitinophagaceae bacterium]HPH30277.1 acetyltransferase [Chitinophagaceae bacterium]HPN57763.1 acetyltransferase [Chitinophagaceae bacterium]
MKNNKKQLVIIGSSSNARLAKFYFDTDSDREVVAFAVNRDYIKEATFEGLPVVALEDLSVHYPPDSYDAFVAVGYNQMNKVREKLYNEAKNIGYLLINYISSRCTFLSQFPVGDNCFILEDNTIQPYVKIGNNVVLWSGNHIGHDVTIGDHCYITSQVVISGFVDVKPYCFLGVNATIRDAVTIAEATLVGAGAVIMKSTEEKGVYLPPRSTIFNKKSDEVVISS